MSIADEDQRAQQEDRLRNAIIGSIEYFRAKYDPLTPDEVAWSHAVTEWLPAWRAWFDGEIKTSPPLPTLVEPRTAAMVEDPKLSAAYYLRGKYWEWRRLWAQTQGLIAAFRANTIPDDDAWKARVAKDMYTLLGASYRELARAHSGMPRIDDIDGAEMIRALYSLDEYADVEDLDDDEDYDLDDEDFDEDDDDDLAGPEQPLS
jgi:hypothetical protein